MQSNGFYVPKRVMVIMAHPDDIEFSCAGTMARWAKLGAKICYVLVTSGDVGIADLSLTREQARDIREVEQKAAAAKVGVEDVVFLREPDGMLVNTLDLRKRLVREIRRYKPDVVVCQDPTAFFVSNTYINHPDHRAAAAAAVDAVFPAAGQPHIFQELEAEGLAAHKVKKVYVSTWREADTYVNISDTIDLKIESLFAHKSQMDEMIRQGRGKLEDIGKWVRDWSSERGEGKEMAYAESFKVITLEEDKPEQVSEGEIVETNS
ncbi:MAG: PIG-L family deacetylase [Chloroflexi bacterium]|nr:PIG-L family deacetylase [Chloroflexota bacterium]